MTTPGRDARAYYLIPARTISGSPEEILAQIDEVVQGLLALRHLIAVRSVNPTARASKARSIVGLTLQSESVNR